MVSLKSKQVLMIRFPLAGRLLSALVGLALCLPGQAQPSDISIDSVLQVIRRIGLEQSQVGELASMLTDVYGPRLSGSPNLARARKWAVKSLTSWDWQQAREDEWGPFGVSWELEHFAMHAYTPGYWPVLAYPKAWSPSVKGEIQGEVVFLDVSEEADLEAYRGKLKGKFVLIDTIREVSEWFDPPASRLEPVDLLDLANAGPDAPRPRRQWQATGGMSFNRTMWKFLHEEKPACVIERHYKGDLGTVFLTGARSGDPEKRAQHAGAVTLPQVTMSVEHFNRLIRLIHRGIVPELSLSLQVKTSDKEVMEANVLAEWPGTDKADEQVVFGAHLDSWHAGTGATDNAAGSAVMLEVARILSETIRETGIKPRRTLQLALWTGEEQGLLGSIAHVRKYYAETEPNSYTPKTLKPAQAKVSAYYNLDNGTGRIRGIYLQGNQEAGTVFRPWLDPFRDLDAATITLKNTGGTDHLPFDGVGIPGFQFIQDPVAYGPRTHHSNMDNFDHLLTDDLRQAATIIAAFVWQTAMRDEMIPRKEQPVEGTH